MPYSVYDQLSHIVRMTHFLSFPPQVNTTTYEKFRRPYATQRARLAGVLPASGNPFDAGFWRNWAEALLPCVLRPPVCVLAAPIEGDIEAPGARLVGQRGTMLTSTASWIE